MKTFKYTVRSPQGSVSDGVIEAATESEAVEQLRSDGLIVTKLEEVTGARDIDLRLGGKRTKDTVLAIMCKQLATIVDAGIPIVRALELVARQTDDKTLKNILKDVADDVSAGYGLAESFEKYGPGLPSTFIESVRAGEASGSLGLVFSRLADYFTKISKTKSKVKSAIIYPAFVLGIAVIVVIVIMVFAVPTFTNTFESMDVEMPLPTVIMISTSNFMVNYWWVILLVIALLFVGVKLLKRYNEPFALQWSKIGTKIPVIGRITRMSACSQYASSMALMLEAGIPIVNGVTVAAQTMSNHYLSHELLQVQSDLEAGRPLSELIAKTGAFPELVSELTGVGEQTGNMEGTLTVLSEYYDNEVETATARALGIMEPLLIVFLAVIVGGILLAVYLPMFSLYGAM